MQVDTGVVAAAQRFTKGQIIMSGLSVITVATNFCRATLKLRPTQSSDINVEVWLPETWNQKLFTHGGGGFSGGLGGPTINTSLNQTLGQGYASATSDLGHPTSSSAQWAYNQPEKVIDMGHRANHLVAVTAKQVIGAYYQSPARQAYFQGCSGGGREAMMAVSRYPADYDGVIAGAPAMSAGETASQLLWNDQLVAGTPALSFKMAALNKAVLAACDTLDGVQDGVLENPQKCRLDPAVLQCGTFNTTSCLTTNEIAVVRKVYEGPKLASGEQLIPGLARGSEGFQWGTGLQTSLGEEYYRWMVYGDPAWTRGSFFLERDYPYSRALLEPTVDSDNPDIGAFVRRGGKLIMYHGWNDTLIPAGNTVRHYERASAIVGNTITDNARLFMVPGMQHCSGGNSPNVFDMVPHLEAWVERGQAPERVIATQRSALSTTPVATRPLCPWPKTAVYNGTGSTKDAVNFTCQEQ
ncbi:hypothetical protein A4W93_06380 [Piscinibacter gummiphilus]|uniref:Uncharacterized protein n=2 Tax=Piscinibacter gummiphilus TaxID=946333 RepID=A0A1W6L5G6_9BURK|nr:hypothetical protein A4W93_06380 [Piscinibacter gummiphilus]GLS92778.1 feruloyl esterase [Piscinibacter gummiphilus]